MSEASIPNQGDVPAVTVAMSVFNGGNYLDLAVKSIVEQTYQNWELLIFDDGSTDGAVDRLLSNKDPRIIVIQDGLNKGLSARLNQAINMARGQYFARMDHDDISHPSRIEEQVNFLDLNLSISLLATKCFTMDENGHINGQLPFAINHIDICRFPWRGFHMAHPSWMGRIEWFRNHYYREPAPYCCEDQELLLRAHNLSNFYTLPKFLLTYRIRSDIQWEKLFRTRLEVLKIQLCYFASNRKYISVSLSLLIYFIRTGRDLLIGLSSRLSLLSNLNKKSIN